MRALATSGLTKDYAVGFWRKRPHRALDRLTLDVDAGEVFGFLGPNGAGKTTTLKLLLQLVFPTSGEARIFGRPPGDLAAKRRLGYLPENPYFYDHLTAGYEFAVDAQFDWRISMLVQLHNRADIELEHFLHRKLAAPQLDGQAHRHVEHQVQIRRIVRKFSGIHSRSFIQLLN